ncbi:MAG: PHP domain-containing protein [Alcaligenaceae bacterium]|nr:PHP domain-containing protein [Alcaligenaceae bacterium]
MSVDLHCHSTISDGVLTPEAVARRAYDNGVRLWSLTDHDETAGQEAARKAAEELGMEYITGIEISVTWQERTLHLVGLNFDPSNLTLNQGLLAIRADRDTRSFKIAEKFDALGIPGTYEGALQLADNPDLISRSHFARYLVQSGHCKTMQEVFDRYLNDQGPANVPTEWASLPDAIAWIKEAGGVSVIAHPGRYKYSRNQFIELWRTFKALGGEAVEVVTGSHTTDQYHQYADICRHYGFMASAGSDFHGPKESRLDIGHLPLLPSGLTPIWHHLGYSGY